MEIQLKAGKFNIEEVPIKKGMEVMTLVSVLAAKLSNDKKVVEGIREALNKKGGINVIKEMFNIIPDMLKKYYEDTINLISLTSGIEREILEKEGMSKLLLVTTAIVKENNYREWQETIKNLLEVIRTQKV